MTYNSLKHSATLVVLLECFDYYQDFVLTFTSSTFLAVLYHDLRHF